VTNRFRAGDIRHCFADIQKIASTYGYAPRCEFEDGVREWWEWAEREPATDRMMEANRELVARQLVR
jgi:dTDP-L-rhamnose 4-epimerase